MPCERRIVLIFKRQEVAANTAGRAYIVVTRFAREGIIDIVDTTAANLVIGVMEACIIIVFEEVVLACTTSLEEVQHYSAGTTTTAD